MQKLFWKESIAVLVAGTRRSIKQFAWEKLRPWHVTPQQCGVLLALDSEGGMSLGEVAGRIWCDNPTACRIVNKLVERGLVRSDSDSQDRRRFRLHLTDEGRALCMELNRAADGIADTLEVGISEEELTTLRRILRKVMCNAVGATQRPDKAIAAATTHRESRDDPAETSHKPARGAPGSASDTAVEEPLDGASSMQAKVAGSSAAGPTNKRVL